MPTLPRQDQRWTYTRKIAVLTALDTGMIDREEAKRRYCLSEEELESWKTNYEHRGKVGVMATKNRLLRVHANNNTAGAGH